MTTTLPYRNAVTTTPLGRCIDDFALTVSYCKKLEQDAQTLRPSVQIQFEIAERHGERVVSSVQQNAYPALIDFLCIHYSSVKYWNEDNEYRKSQAQKIGLRIKAKLEQEYKSWSGKGLLHEVSFVEFARAEVRRLLKNWQGSIGSASDIIRSTVAHLPMNAFEDVYEFYLHYLDLDLPDYRGCAIFQLAQRELAKYVNAYVNAEYYTYLETCIASQLEPLHKSEYTSLIARQWRYRKTAGDDVLGMIDNIIL